jgi:hypothetical protein
MIRTSPKGLFAVWPTVSATGILSFTINNKVTGEADCTVTLAETTGSNWLSTSRTLHIVIMEGELFTRD